MDTKKDNTRFYPCALPAEAMMALRQKQAVVGYFGSNRYSMAHLICTMQSLRGGIAMGSHLDTFVPKPYIYKKFDPAVLAALMKQQNRIIVESINTQFPMVDTKNELSRAELERHHTKFVIFEGLTIEDMKDSTFENLMMNARHYLLSISLIVNTDNADHPPARIMSSLDWMFVWPFDTGCVETCAQATGLDKTYLQHCVEDAKRSRAHLVLRNGHPNPTLSNSVFCMPIVGMPPLGCSDYQNLAKEFSMPECGEKDKTDEAQQTKNKTSDAVYGKPPNV